MRTEILDVNGQKYPLKIHFEDRNDSRVSVSKSAVNIRLPRSLTREELFRELLRMKAWAKQQIFEKPQRYKRDEAKTYKDGDVLQVGNEQYVLHVSFKEKQSSSARIIGNTIQLAIASQLSEQRKNRHISSLLSRCVAKKRISYLHDKIDGLNNTHFNQRLKKIFFKNNKSNWGSCSEQGNLNISTRLLFAPDDVLEYVCIHELAHLIEFNHSDAFWALVEKTMPDYKQKEQWLKEHGGRCMF